MTKINQVIHADCLLALPDLADGSVSLIYLDPPFNTHIKQKTAHASYEDAFGDPADYIAYMRPRVQQLRRVLAPNGALFFHCDWRTSHHVRVMLDELFAKMTTDDTPPTVIGQSLPLSVVGRRSSSGCFINEIIWHYGLGAAKARRQLLTKHDVIFWYANGPGYTFNLIREAPTQAMLAKYCHIEEDGQRYMMSYGKRYYLKGGKPLDDVWRIPAIAPTSGERVGYPTQKPLVLLQRIVELASNLGDLVLDPFCGSGTTLVAAQQLGRHYIGIDANPQAIEMATKRLQTLQE